MEKPLIVTGHFGSGKSEFALNLAKHWNKQGEQVVLVDIDIVNPYFCLREFKDDLMIRGIELIMSDPYLTNAELMVLPPQVSGAFCRENSHVIMDVGGDDSGAVVLGRYHAHLRGKPYDMVYVVNPCRPMTCDASSVIENLRRVEKSARLKATALVANPNLSYETTEEDVIAGEKTVFEISKLLGLPVAYTLVREDLAEKLKWCLMGNVFPIQIHLKPPWQ